MGKVKKPNLLAGLVGLSDALDAIKGELSALNERGARNDKIITMLLAQNRALNERNLFLLQAAGLKASIDNYNARFGQVAWPAK